MADDKVYKPLPKGTWPVTMGKKDRMAWGIQTGPTSRSLVTTVRIDGPAVAKSIQVAGTIGPFGSAHAQLKVSNGPPSAAAGSPRALECGA